MLAFELGEIYVDLCTEKGARIERKVAQEPGTLHTHTATFVACGMH
jgi:hypothetical protein